MIINKSKLKEKWDQEDADAAREDCVAFFVSGLNSLQEVSAAMRDGNIDDAILWQKSAVRWFQRALEEMQKIKNEKLPSLPKAD